MILAKAARQVLFSCRRFLALRAKNWQQVKMIAAALSTAEMAAIGCDVVDIVKE
jgi:hypothetical protein